MVEFFEIHHMYLSSEKIVASIAIAAVVSALSMVVLVPLAKRIGLTDAPGGRKKHHGQIPLVGGAGIFIGSIAGLIYLGHALPAMYAFASAVSLLFIVGILDDYFDIPAYLKLVAQVIAALIMVWWGGTKIEGLSNLIYPGRLDLGGFSLPVTVLAVVGYINAINMSDGVDGLAGTLTLVPMLVLSWVAYSAGYAIEGSYLAIFSVSVFVFLIFNARHPLRKRAGIFLGDAGSLILGLTVAWFVIHLAKVQPRCIDASTALWIVGVPFIDLVAVTLQRIIKGRSPFVADRAHFHHLLLLAGFNVNQTVVIISGLALVFAVFGVLGQSLSLSGPVLFYLFLMVFIMGMVLLNYAWRASRLMAKLRRYLRNFLRNGVN